MGTVRVGARLAPVLGFSHRPNLPSCGGVIHTDRKFGLFSFFKVLPGEHHFFFES